MHQLSHNAIREYAHLVIDHFDLTEIDRGAALHRLVHRLGGSIDRAPSVVFPYLMLVHDVRNFVIYLPQVTGQIRNNQVIAQALGHYYLDYLLPERTEEAIFEHNSTKYSTRRANIFGAELLCPAAIYTMVAEDHGNDPWIVADQLKISPSLVEIRARHFAQTISA